MNFADALIEKTKQRSMIIVGLDPNFDLMPDCLMPKSSHPNDVRRALVQFSKIVIDNCYDLVPAIKIQSAFYEQFGNPGIAALSDVIAHGKDKGLLIILDTKRGDIGSTSLAYAKAYLEGYTELRNGIKILSDLEVDCITTSPFLGADSIEPFVETAINNNKGVFILVKTSNPGSKLFLDQDVNGQPIAHKIAELVNELGQKAIGKHGFSSIGAVIGATLDGDNIQNYRKLMPQSLFLMPGCGAQGGSMDTIHSTLNADGIGTVIPISRGITYIENTTADQEAYALAIRQNLNHFISLSHKKTKTNC